MAITITPTRSGMNVGLSDIAVILSEQNQVLAQTAESQQKLTTAFKDYLKMLAGQDMDDLQDERREKAENKTSMGGMSMRGMSGGIMGAAGSIKDYIMGFGKRFLPVLAGLVFGDELLDGLYKAVETYLGVSISENLKDAIELGVVGGLAGFLFGGFKGGLYGMIFGAMMSKPVREKIAAALEKITGEDFDANSIITMGTAALGSLLLIFSPAIIGGAIKSFFKTPGGEKAKGKITKGFASRLATGAGVLFVGEALADQIDAAYGEQAGDIASTIAKGAAFGSMFGPKGMLVGAIGFLAIQGGAKLIDYLRNKNQQLFDDAIKKSDEAIDRYKETGDVKILQDNEREIAAANTEANRMLQIGRASGRYDEAVEAADKSAIYLATARGVDSAASIQAENRRALSAGGQSILDQAYAIAMEKAARRGRDNPNKDDINQALFDMHRSAGLYATTEQKEMLTGEGRNRSMDLLMERASTGLSQQARTAMENYGSRSTGSSYTDLSTTSVDQSTNSNSATVLSGGGATDNADHKAALLTTSGL